MSARHGGFFAEEEMFFFELILILEKRVYVLYLFFLHNADIFSVNLRKPGQ